MQSNTSNKRPGDEVLWRRAGRPRKQGVHTSVKTVDLNGNIIENNKSGNKSLPPGPQQGAQHHHAVTTVGTDGSISTRTIASFAATPLFPSSHVIPELVGPLPGADSIDEDLCEEADGMRFDVTEPLERNFDYSSFQELAKFDEEFHPTTKTRVRNPEDGPMHRWVKHDRDVFLEELIRLEGRGPFKDIKTCNSCGSSEEAPTHRCLDCTDFGQLVCQRCIIRGHRHLPFHRIEVWSTSHFTRVSLKSLGMRIQLGHPRGNACSNPKRASLEDDFVVIHSTGVHEVALDFCECQEPGTKRHALQLLRAGLYPATSTNPRTAATFGVLKQFSMLTYESKMSPFAFIKALERLTDNTGTMPVKDRRDEFLAMYQQWRHLKMLKRAGRGHDPTGALGTSPGECALLCPACPLPGINLPPGWELDEVRAWLYALFLGIDGNFRLKRKLVSDDIRDPGLNLGYAYVVEEKEFKSCIAANWDYKQERSTCVDHNAVNESDKETRGLAATGATTTDCIRHDFKRPNGVGDFQRGERYINTDYVLFSSLRDTKIQRINVSYDIACQHSKNLDVRNLLLPEHLRWSGDIKAITFFIPKFHIKAHIPHCQLNYSFNLTKGVGRTDGEAPERGWAAINPIASSTKEMGPGNRRDTLDDHFNDYNWTKITDFARSMLEKMKKAVPERSRHGTVLRDFEATLDQVEGPLSHWKQAVEAWEADRSNPNPYETAVTVTSERDVRLQLAQEAAKEEINAKYAEEVVDYVTLMHAASDVHPSAMIAMGLDLEEAQRKLATDAKTLGLHPTKKQVTDIVDRSTKLRRRIATWSDIQAAYMPEAIPQREASVTVDVAGISGASAPNIPLCLPSSITSASIKTSRRLCMYEWKLREGQAYDCLDTIRHSLRLYTHLFINKKKYNRGNKQNTRANDAITSAQTKANQAREKYLVARAAMKKLAPRLDGDIPTNWMNKLRDLKVEDVKGLAQSVTGETEGTRQISWIWIAEGALPEDSSSGLHEALRVEWCRARARAMRWDEEVTLLSEEMRRVLAFHVWKSEWWKERGKELVLDPETREGMDAYASEQASLWLRLAMECSNAWADIPRFKALYDVE